MFENNITYNPARKKKRYINLREFKIVFNQEMKQHNTKDFSVSKITTTENIFNTKKRETITNDLTNKVIELMQN